MSLDFLSQKYESLDYDQCENYYFLLEQRQQQRNLNILRNKGFKRWIVILFIGILTALTACGIVIATDKLASYKFHFLMTKMNQCDNSSFCYTPLFYWMGINATLVAIGSIMVTYWAPVAAGSGIPVVKCYLNGVKVPEVVRFKTFVSKAVGVIFSVVGGLATGKEGPMIHCGAVIAAGVSQGKSTTFKKDTHLLDEFKDDREKRDFVSAGAAAGVAAAFGAPIGGVLFSLEEGASFWNQALTWRIFFCSMITTFTLNIVLSIYHNHAGQLSYPGLINFGKFGEINYAIYEIPIYAFLGAIGGILGALHNSINLRLSMIRLKYINRNWSKVAESVFISIFTCSIAYSLIYLDEDCHKKELLSLNETIRAGCKESEFSVMSYLWLATPEATISRLFHSDDDMWTWKTLLIFFVCYFFLATWTYGISVSSGLFIPSLIVGATGGRLFYLLVKHTLPDESDWADGCKFALIGAAAMLGGVVRMTISLTVIMIETTGNITFGPPIMITLIVSKWVGDYFNHESIYDIHIRLAAIPFLYWEPPSLSTTVYASEIMSAPVVALRSVEKVDRIIQVLENETHNGFPVVDTEEFDFTESGSSLEPSYSSPAHYGRFRGLILRWQLIVLLQEKIFNENDEYHKITAGTFRDAYPRYPPIEKIINLITDQERQYSIDLRPVMNPSPYSMSHTASLNRIFQLFRALGLRHLVIVNDYNEVVGIVTRKDIARYRQHCHRGKLFLQTLQISV
ncbi:H(+)/Cl(-) exchange transporter 7 [Tetranychus urticae]|uniref:Chloride channel protein n=1 Tax=Tetranychus urticae TaxID=32264 RepID=T1K5M1_TETUR|nr:H(+)/Cl(-) exchange transporter 7 [Tetranychus urticae]